MFQYKPPRVEPCSCTYQRSSKGGGDCQPKSLLQTDGPKAKGSGAFVRLMGEDGSCWSQVI